MSKQNKEPSFEIDKIKLFIAIILFLILSYGIYIAMNQVIDDAKKMSENKKKVDICIEIDNNNSIYVKHINDELWINGKKYKYSDLKLQCELKNRTNLNKQIENITQYLNNTLYK